MINVKIEKDSIAPSGIRLTTFILEYPRFIHSELMTHRVFSRNASSSRAIPLKKQIEMLKQNIAYPEYFTENQKGMQGYKKLSDIDQTKAKHFWYMAAQNAIKQAELLGLPKEDGGLNVHKQHCNRILEPFSHISVVLTGTDFENFFGLRYHHMAQPEIEKLAKEMYSHYNSSNPETLRDGEWHLPFVSEADKMSMRHTEQIYKSVACCARVSYKNHEGKEPSSEQNKILYDRLLSEQPLHASPAEHQAMAVGDPGVRSGNFKGWIQYRQTLKGHIIKQFKKEK